MAQNRRISADNIVRSEPAAKAKPLTAVWYVTLKAGRPVLTMLWFPELP
jgi:hypothetical protein